MSLLHRRATSADLVALALSRHRSRIAFVKHGRSLRYGDVEERVYATARALVGELGVPAGGGVGCLAANSPEGWIVTAAALLAGARYTPLNTRSSIDDLCFICGDSELSVVAYDESFAEHAAAIAETVGCRTVELGQLQALADRCSNRPFRPAATEGDVAVVAYTGGTTGQPKGVVLPHRATVANVNMTLADWELPREPRVLLVTPLSHSAGTMVVPTLLRGGTIHLLDGFDPDSFLATIERERINMVLGVPTLLYALLDAPELERYDTSSLDTFVYGSSPISTSRLEEALNRIGPVFCQLYGQTEAPNTVTYLPKADHDPERPHLLASCGQPMVGVDVSILARDGSEAGVGAEGEICVRGPIVMDGYWKRPDATAEALRDGWLHTGDVARRDADGYLYIVDRLKDVVISGGFNVYPREIEEVLGDHPAVAASAVIGVPHEKWGEAVRAFVVPRPGRTCSADELQALVRARKGPVHVPKAIEFVEALPLTPVGKPDKVALRKSHWANHERAVH